MTNRAARALGRLGGLAWAASLSTEEMRERTSKAGRARWDKDTTPKCPHCGQRHRLKSRRDICAAKIRS